MNEQERLEYAGKELEAIYEDLEENIKQQLLIKKFLGHLLEMLKNPESNFVLTR